MKNRFYCCVLALVIGSALLFSSCSSQNKEIYRARADIRGAEGSGVSGYADFVQISKGVVPTVLVTLEVTGLEPGSGHGCHIHENGTCEPTFGAAGGHLDSGPYGMANPDANHPFHMGDLPNLVADNNGVARFEHRTSRVTLSDGPLTLFDDNGSAVIVHVDPDLGTTGQKGGAGGARLACGTIQKR